MQTNTKTPKQALNPAFLKQKQDREEIELFKKELISLLDKINDSETEIKSTFVLKNYDIRLFESKY